MEPELNDGYIRRIYDDLRAMAPLKDGGRSSAHLKRAVLQVDAVKSILAGDDLRSEVDVVHDALTTAARAASTTPSVSSPDLSLGELASAALGLDEFAGVSGLGNRLKLYANRKEKSLSTVRNRYPEALAAVSQILPTLTVDEVRPRGLPPRQPPATALVYLDSTVRHVLHGRIPVRTYVDCTIAVHGPPMHSHTVRGLYPNDLSIDSFSIVPISNCQLFGVQEAGTGAHRITLRLPETRTGETVHFAYAYQVNSAKVDRPYLRNQARTEVLRASVGVQFEAGDLPSRVWFFANQGIEYEPLDEPEKWQLVKPNRVGYVERSFPRQTANQCYGFAWTWASEL